MTNSETKAETTSLAGMFRKTLKLLFFLVSSLFLIFTAITIFEVVRSTVKDVSGAITEKIIAERSHFLALAYQGNEEAVQMLLDRIRGTDSRISLRYIKAPAADNAKLGDDIFSLNYGGNNYGRIILHYRWLDLVDLRILIPLILSTVLLFCSFLFIYARSRKTVMDGVIRPLDTINETLGQYRGVGELGKLPMINSNFMELRGLVRALRDAGAIIAENEERKRENEVLRAESELAAQVYHDIASPLFALNIASERLDSVSPDRQKMIRDALKRIQDICYDLGKHKHPASVREVDLSTCINEIIEEKKLSLGNSSEIRIVNESKAPDKLKVSVDSGELKRIFSNLINNSIEAMRDNKGNIWVRVDENQNEICVSIEDDGRGIPEHQLKQLGKKGFSFGKERFRTSGHGLGIYHAKKALSQWGAELAIDSEEGKGTIVRLKMPKVRKISSLDAKKALESYERPA